MQRKVMADKIDIKNNDKNNNYYLKESYEK